jgi:hypothetical protein
LLRVSSSTFPIGETSKSMPKGHGEMLTFYECGICGSWHPWEWAGDCRQDDARFPADLLDQFYGVTWELRDMEERLAADLEGTR